MSRAKLLRKHRPDLIIEAEYSLSMVKHVINLIIEEHLRRKPVIHFVSQERTSGYVGTVFIGSMNPTISRINKYLKDRDSRVEIITPGNLKDSKWTYSVHLFDKICGERYRIAKLHFNPDKEINVYHIILEKL